MLGFELPSWAIFGMKVQGTYLAWASESLTQVEIRQGFAFSSGYPWIGPGTQISMEVRGFRVGRGASWQEAMANLFGAEGWDPDRPSAPAPRSIEQANRELEANQKVIMARPEFDPDTGRSPLDDWLKD